jgi:hypothetical protein
MKKVVRIDGRLYAVKENPSKYAFLDAEERWNNLDLAGRKKLLRSIGEDPNDYDGLARRPLGTLSPDAIDVFEAQAMHPAKNGGGPRFYLLKGIPKDEQARVQKLYYDTIGRGDANARTAFLSVLQDIGPISQEIRVSKPHIVKVLLFGTGYNLPKKYAHLLKA